MDGASVAEQVGSFAREVEGIVDGLGESAARGQGAGGDVAVGAAREGVGVPIVEPGVLQAGERGNGDSLQ